MSLWIIVTFNDSLIRRTCLIDYSFITVFISGCNKVAFLVVYGILMHFVYLINLLLLFLHHWIGVDFDGFSVFYFNFYSC